MSRRRTLSTSGRVTVAALLAASAGIAIQIVSGVDFPPVPPGLVVLLGAAALVTFAPWRWAPAVGAAAGLFLLVGFFASGQLETLFDMQWFGRFVGIWILLIALIAAVITGTASTLQNYRTRRGEAGR